MAMYYLARPRSSEVAGPFAEGRLVAMADAGEIEPGDQLAMHGTEDWLPAEAVLDGLRMSVEESEMQRPRRPVRSAKRVRHRPLFGASIVVIALGIGLMIFFSWWVGIIMIVVGVLIDRPRWTCEACANEVEKTSVRCPVCACALVRK